MKITHALLVACVTVSASLLSISAHAATSQQNRMTTCNADAKTNALAGDARKAFMKSCLSGETAAAAAPASTQQEKMKTCNADAGKQALKGDARKQFMSGCLKAK
jgi:psiF repeat